MKSQRQIVVAGKIDVRATADFDRPGVLRGDVRQVPPQSVPPERLKEVLVSAFAPSHDPLLAANWEFYEQGQQHNTDMR
jgi:hypothetical protein